MPATEAIRPPLVTPLLLDWRRARIGVAELTAWLKDPASRINLKRAQDMKSLGIMPDKSDRRLYELQDGIAYIPIRGPLFNDSFIDPFWGWSGYKGLSVQFAAAIADPEVRAVLFDIDSPGGVVSGCFDLVDEIFAGRGQVKPIWAVANDSATSAAYAIASAADLVFLPRLGAVGSIGVWTLHVDLSRALDDAGITVTPIFAGKHKIDGHPFAPLPADVLADMQADVDHTHELFIATVARNREMPPEAVRATEARVFDDREAVGIGLADAIATDKEVAQALSEEVQVNPPA